MSETFNCGGTASCEKVVLQASLHEVISQYKNSPNFIAYVSTYINEAIKIIDNIEELSLVLGIDCVEGKVLDLIGSIVGQERIWYDPGALPWFGFDDGGADPQLEGFGSGKFWDGVTELVGNYVPADDNTYRMFLKAKIVRNNSRGTLEDMNTSVRLITCRNDIQVNGANGIAQVPFAVSDGLPDWRTAGFGNGQFFGSGASLYTNGAYSSAYGQGFNKPEIKDNVVYDVMKFELIGTNGPIDTVTKVFMLQYDLLPTPVGVKLIGVN